MASGLTLQRSQTAASGSPAPPKMPNLPVIQHPMAKLGNKDDLAVRGSSSMGPNRENTFVTVRGGKTELGLKKGSTLDRENTSLRKSAPERILNWPPDIGGPPRVVLEPINRRHEKSPPRSGRSLRAGVDPKQPFSYKRKPVELLPSVVGTPRRKKRGGIPNKTDKFPVLTQIPRLPPLPSIEEQEEYLKGPGKGRMPSKEYKFQPRNTDELMELIKEKMQTGYFGVRHLFKSNDPSGKGTVSREALQRILYTLCGYITPDQYTRLLKVANLEGKPSIPFDNFVKEFKVEVDKKNWVDMLQTSVVYGADGEACYPEANLRRTDMHVHNPYTSMPFSDAIFKEKCRSKNFDAKKAFPPAVFESDGLILPPQLREAHATLGIFMTDEDFKKLWQRYDREGTGAIYASNFFKMSGLDATGKPRNIAYTPRGAAYPMPRHRPHSEISHTASLDRSPSLLKLLAKEASTPIKIPTDGGKENGADEGAAEKSDSETEKKANGGSGEKTTKGKPSATDAQGTDRKETTKTTDGQQKQDESRESKESEDRLRHIRTKPHRVAPKLENIIDCLHFKFEESYNACLSAFQLFDFLNDGYISRIDFRRVLKEFGFNIAILELDNFLRRTGLRTIKGQVSYKEFLVKYQNKSDTSLTAKIATDAKHSFHSDHGANQTELTSDALEARLVEFFHGDFVKLLSHFRQCDKYSLGVVTGHEFRAGIERRLGYTVSEKQWEQLKSDVGTDSDGLVPFNKFLEMFDILPGAWNQKSEGLILVSQIAQSEMPVPGAVDRLKETAKVTMKAPDESKPVTNVRSLNEINHRKDMDVIQKQLDELFKNRFHTFDKNFKQMDRRMTGRMSKWQFGALLKMCGLSLEPKELDKLWATLNIATDGMYSYSTLIQHFVNYRIPQEERETVVFENLFNVDEQEEYMYNHLTEEDTTALVDTARRIQRERKEERAQRQALIRARQSKSPDSQPSPHIEPPMRAHTSANGFRPPLSRASTIPYTPPASRASFSSVQSVNTKALLVKIRSDVIGNWEGLKSVFKYIDRQGAASIGINEMKEIMTSMQFTLDEEEMSELCRRFDLGKTGRFNYLEFMKCYAQKTPRPGQQNTAQVYSKYTHKLEQQILQEHKSLRRAFRKLDKSNNGYLSVTDFKQALRECNISFTNEDFYHILTEFDHDMSGKITYDNFMTSILTL